MRKDPEMDMNMIMENKLKNQLLNYQKVMTFFYFIMIIFSYLASFMLNNFLHNDISTTSTLVNEWVDEGEVFREERNKEEVWNNGSKLYESLVVVPLSIILIYYTSMNIDISLLKGDVSQVSSEFILITRSWGILLFIMFGLIITYAEEPLISVPIFILTILTSFCGYFILEPYMISCFHVLSTLGWVGLFDLSLRTNTSIALYQFPYQSVLALMLVSSYYLRTLLGNEKQYHNISFQLIGVPILLLIYWSFEIPGCELLRFYFHKDVEACQYSHNFRLSNEASTYTMFAVIFVLQLCHLFFGKLWAFSLLGASGEVMDLIPSTPVAEKQQKRASRNANRLEGGRAASIEIEKSDHGRVTSGSVSSTDSDSNLSSSASYVVSPIGGSITTKRKKSHKHKGETYKYDCNVPSSMDNQSDFLPTLSLLSSIQKLSFEKFSLPFSNLSHDFTSQEGKSSQEACSHSSNTLPSASHLLNKVPSLSPIPVVTPWGIAVKKNDTAIDKSIAVVGVNSTTTAFSDAVIDASPHDLGQITEAEAVDIVQKGLLHMKNLRAN